MNWILRASSVLRWGASWAQVGGHIVWRVSGALEMAALSHIHASNPVVCGNEKLDPAGQHGLAHASCEVHRKLMFALAQVRLH